MRRIYIATGYANKAEHNRVRDALKEYGFDLTYDWTQSTVTPEDGIQAHWPIAVRELEAVRDAEAVLVILPGGRGTHAELGAALALGVPVVLWHQGELWANPGADCIFYTHPLVERVSSWLSNIIAIVHALERAAIRGKWGER